MNNLQSQIRQDNSREDCEKLVESFNQNMRPQIMEILTKVTEMLNSGQHLRSSQDTSLSQNISAVKHTYVQSGQDYVSDLPENSPPSDIDSIKGEINKNLQWLKTNPIINERFLHGTEKLESILQAVKCINMAVDHDMNQTLNFIRICLNVIEDCESYLLVIMTTLRSMDEKIEEKKKDTDGVKQALEYNISEVHKLTTHVLARFKDQGLVTTFENINYMFTSLGEDICLKMDTLNLNLLAARDKIEQKVNALVCNKRLSEKGLCKADLQTILTMITVNISPTENDKLPKDICYLFAKSLPNIDKYNEKGHNNTTHRGDNLPAINYSKQISQTDFCHFSTGRYTQTKENFKKLLERIPQNSKYMFTLDIRVAGKTGKTHTTVHHHIPYLINCFLQGKVKHTWDGELDVSLSLGISSHNPPLKFTCQASCLGHQFSDKVVFKPSPKGEMAELLIPLGRISYIKGQGDLRVQFTVVWQVT